MRQSARPEPTPIDDRDDVPRDSVTRLISTQRECPDPTAPAASLAHTRPTTPVPSFYLFLTQHTEDEAYAHVLAGRLADLADDPLDLSARAANVDDYSTFETPGPRSLYPASRSSVPPPIVRGMSSVLSSISRVPYLRRTPLEIPLASINHAQAFVLALINGQATIAQILDASPLPSPRVLRILNDLLESGIIALAG